MKLQDVLNFPSLARAEVVAGRTAARDVIWSHVVDLPDPVPWMRPGFLMLTTGYSWPEEENAQRRQVADLARAGIAGVVLAVPKFVKHFSAAARRQADRSELPLIEIPFEVPFSQISEELHRAIMMEPYAIIERSERIHRALTRLAVRDSTLHDLAHELGVLIDRSVTFEDPGGKLLAAHSVSSDQLDDVRRETLARGESPLITVGGFKREALNRRLSASEGPLRFAAEPEQGVAARVACAIRIGKELVGVVWIIEGSEPLTELDHRAAEHAALIAAIHIAHQRELATTRSRLGYASLLSLLESATTQTPIADERVRLLGFDSTASYRVGIAELPHPLPLDRDGLEARDRAAAAIAEALLRAKREQLVTASLNYVAFLLPDDFDAANVVAALDPKLSIVLGRAYRGPEGARASYREALSLLRYRDRKRVCTYDDLLVPRVIMGDPDARDAFLDDFFAPLRQRKNGKDLARAVLGLARQGFRFRNAADALGIHPNTLRYRLDRVSEALDLDLNDVDVQFRLQLAARLLDAEKREW